MKENLKYTLMVAGMVISWSIYYAVSKIVVDVTGSPLLAGFLLRTAALVFLTIQLLADRIRALKELAGLRSRLRELDGDVDVPELAAACLRHPLMNNNPRRFTRDELVAMFEALR